MKLPRDLSGRQLARALAKYGYVVDHQSGSHIRMTTLERGEHHVTIPDHATLRVGTLSAVLRDVALHFGIDRDALVSDL